MGRSVEVERKFAADPEQALPSLDGIVSEGEPETFTLRATYFDTPDLVLARNRRTLRRREGGDDEGWHLKTPASDDGSRNEFHEPLDASPDPLLVPDALRARVAELIDRAALLPVASLRTTRTQTPLVEHGRVVALLADDHVQARSLPDGPEQQWREVEVELVGDADPELLARIAQRFADGGVQPSSSVSKLAQTLGERVANAEAGNPDPRAGDVVMQYLATQLGVLQTASPLLAVNAPDSVHKARVASRRMRSALRSYRPLFGKADKCGKDLKWLGELLGHARDAEVLQERLAGHSEVVDWVLADRHASAHADLVAALGTHRYARVLAKLTRFVADPPFTNETNKPAAQVLPALLEHAEGEPATFAEQAHAASGQERLHLMHEARKAAKRARYAAEVAGVVTDAALWEAVTETLGKAQDCVVAQETLTQLATQHAGTPHAMVLAQLADQERAMVEQYINAGEAALQAAVSGQAHGLDPARPG